MAPNFGFGQKVCLTFGQNLWLSSRFQFQYTRFLDLVFQQYSKCLGLFSHGDAMITGKCVIKRKLSVSMTSMENCDFQHILLFHLGAHLFEDIEDEEAQNGDNDDEEIDYENGIKNLLTGSSQFFSIVCGDRG